GIEPTRELVEMMPKLLYSGGGMRTDTQGRTTIEGLWAAGAASSNSWSGGGGGQGGLGCASAAITGFVAGEHAASYAASASLQDIDSAEAARTLERVMAPMNRKGDTDASVVTYRVHDAVVPMKYTRQREAGRMREALGIVNEAKKMLTSVGAGDFHDLVRYHQAESMALAAEFTFKTALMRQESRAGHFREDFPERDDANWFKWITVQQKNGSPELGSLRVPLEKFSLRPE
ncbi:MAG: FAD-binding protein, partial [Dehalococcoidales bacterium]|nr:FAD-binding protein [Dehalococcoidales bacterium]